jgi:hypothetical protein
LHKTLQTFLTLVWSLWLGGLIALFIAVTSLFSTFADDHALAGVAASGIFWRFNRYQLVLAALALIGSFAWRVASGKSSVTVLFTFFALASFATIMVAGIIIPRLESLRLEHQTHTPEFVRLHGISMLFYLAETICLLIGGLMIPTLIRGADRE